MLCVSDGGGNKDSQSRTTSYFASTRSFASLVGILLRIASSVVAVRSTAVEVTEPPVAGGMVEEGAWWNHRCGQCVLYGASETGGRNGGRIGVGVWSSRGRGGGGEGDYRRRMGAILVVMSGDSGRGGWWTVCSGEIAG